jgi:hypothetical protein
MLLDRILRFGHRIVQRLDQRRAAKLRRRIQHLIAEEPHNPYGDDRPPIVRPIGMKQP